jgi:hypothetical protein
MVCELPHNKEVELHEREQLIHQNHALQKEKI